jgi:hypothetical protein
LVVKCLLQLFCIAGTKNRNENSNMRCYDVLSGKQVLMFQRSIVPPLSEISSPGRVLDPNGGDNMPFRNINMCLLVNAA